MQYNHLKSIVAAREQIALATPSESFFLVLKRPDPFIEPIFSKIEFPHENPSIIFVQAIGASGKTTTARALSFDLKIPILDLAKHAAVGDRTLTGVLTDSYALDDISTVLKGFHGGTYGVIIDGIDEARSKTTEESFEAFLYNILHLSKGSESSAIVVLGRNQVLLEAWCYLRDQKANVGLVAIDPFGLQESRSYIDFHIDRTTVNRQTYKNARDHILKKLEKAFQPSEPAEENSFLTFVGYPPVLDAIVTLLTDEENHYQILSKLEDDEHTGNIEAELLIKISNHLLDRERDKSSDSIDKMIQGITHGKYLKEHLYSREEQCARILAKELSQQFRCQISWPKEMDEHQKEQLRRDYEEYIEKWCGYHPFLEEDKESVRNSVFSAVAIMHCAFSDVPEYQKLAYEYANSHQPTYHLLYIMGSRDAGEHAIDARMFNPLIQSSSDGFTLDTDIDVRIIGKSWEEEDFSEDGIASLEIEMTPPGGVTKSFYFSGKIMSDKVIVLGPSLINLSVTLPCTVQLAHGSGVMIRGSCSVSALVVRINTSDLTVRAVPTKADGNTSKETSELFIDAQSVEGSVDRVAEYGTIRIQAERHTLVHPLAKYFFPRTESTGYLGDNELRDRFRRLRRILMEFAARKRGGLARYKNKIENRRVLSSDMAERVLAALIANKVLALDGHLYRLDLDECSNVLGVSWQQLRNMETSQRLRDFLESIE